MQFNAKLNGLSGDVVVIFVHGINVTCQDYYAPMRDRILRQLPREIRRNVIFRAVFWADIVRGRQQEYLLYARNSSAFDGTNLHRLVIEGLGDAAAYQRSNAKSSAYNEIQARLRKTISDVCLGPDDRRPLIFVAHSLGCHIVSSFAWDLHRHRSEADNAALSPFERLDTFAGFVTMGSNQPLFTFNIGPQFVLPITRAHKEGVAPAFPGPELPDDVRSHVRWLNFFSSNDPLGYPLKPLNEAYDQDERISDHPVAAEGWWRSRLLRGRLRQLCALKAHTGYWTNRTVVRDTARLIRTISEADQKASAAPAITDPAASLMPRGSQPPAA
jgi:hypothetical protein